MAVEPPETGSQPGMNSHILWQNEEATITLIDVPRSITNAQGFNTPADHDMLSCPAREAPYPSSEPKSAAAKANLMNNTVDDTLHAEYQRLLTQALQEARKHHGGSWCLSRPFVEDAQPTRKKRKLDEVDHSQDEILSCPPSSSAQQHLPNHYLSRLARAPILDNKPLYKLQADSTVTPGGGSALEARFFSNKSDDGILISTPVQGEQHSKDLTFRVPSRSSFYLGDCQASYDFRKAIREHARQNQTKATFDFILLDPPWPNRSIKRTHQTAGATYKTIATLHELRDAILDMQLESLMSADALLGVWITNKQAVRELVLGSGGFFDCWDMALVEEWVWLKTTNFGEPTSELNATWKKPYETLLLARKRTAASAGGLKASAKRKVIIGVPDLHSRKPCLKSLIEPMLAHADGYTALEVFARHLVTGWCSWGDESIKFNWDGYWKE